MMTGNQARPEKGSTAATARLDRGLTTWERKRWVHQLAGKIRLAIDWRIPVGFEDEGGFHLGVQAASQENRLALEKAGIFAGDKHF